MAETAVWADRMEVDEKPLPWDKRPYVPPVIPGFKTPKFTPGPIPPREPMSTAAIEYERRKAVPPNWSPESIRKVISEGEYGMDLHIYHGQHTAMWFASKLGMWDEVLQLLDLGADPQAMDEYEYTAMMWAARAFSRAPG